MTDTLAELQKLKTYAGDLRHGLFPNEYTVNEVIELMQGSIDRILSEYQSPLAWLDKPETVEEVARAMHNSEYVCELSERDGFIQEGYIEQAQAAISVIKRLAGSDITAMQNQKEDE